MFREFITAWRLAAMPTRRSPVFVNATIDGVVRPPSAFGTTTGCPPSMTDMQEFVVPKSIPSTFAIVISSTFRHLKRHSFSKLYKISNFVISKCHANMLI